MTPGTEGRVGGMGRITFGRILAAVAMLGVGVTAGCGGPPAEEQTHNVKIDVGGSVVYALDASEPLPSVLITLTDVEGETRTAQTTSAGLWAIEDIAPGVYTESYALAGYETQTGTFTIPAGGENNVRNVFMSRGTIGLSETGMIASISPFSVEVENGDELRDGLAGSVMVYSSAGNGDIVVTFPRYVASGTVQLRDLETNQSLNATPDTNRMIWTFDEADIGQINFGTEMITLDQEPYTWHRIQLNNIATYTPIHGDVVTLSANLYFNATP